VPAAPARDAGAGGVDAQSDSWALPIDAAFQLMLDEKLANDADGAWRRGSLRQFTATRRLCNEFFGERPSGGITPAMLKDWIEALQRLPASHGKSPKHPPFLEHCALADEEERDRREELETTACRETWSRKDLEVARAAARTPRLAPQTVYRHQVYLNEVFGRLCWHDSRRSNPTSRTMLQRDEQDEACIASLPNVPVDSSRCLNWMLPARLGLLGRVFRLELIVPDARSFQIAQRVRDHQPQGAIGDAEHQLLRSLGPPRLEGMLHCTQQPVRMGVRM